MKDYYKILNINKNSTKEEIKKSYKNHINRFIGLPLLTDKMILEIKEYKIAKYIFMIIEEIYTTIDLKKQPFIKIAK